MEVSVHTIAGNKAHNTIKVLGKMKGKVITLLIDTGSSHSFINSGLVRELGLTTKHAPPLLVTVATGQKFINESVCPGVTWVMVRG